MVKYVNYAVELFHALAGPPSRVAATGQYRQVAMGSLSTIQFDSGLADE